MTCVQPIGARLRRRRQLAHRGRAVGKGRATAARSAIVQAELAQHVGEVDAGGRALRVGEVDARRRAAARPQRLGAVDTSGSGSPARTATPVRTRPSARRRVAAAARRRRPSASIIAVGDDHHVAAARRPAAPPSSRRPRRSGRAAPRRSRPRSAAAAPRRGPARRRRRAGAARHRRIVTSGFAPEILTMRAHFAMSSLDVAARTRRRSSSSASRPAPPSRRAPRRWPTILRDLGVEPVDDRRRRALRRHQAEPDRRLVAGHAGLGDRRHVGQAAERVLAGGRQRLAPCRP